MCKMSDKLLPCPFCGGKARLEQIPDNPWDKFVVTCDSSKCCAFYIGYCDEGLYDTRGKAIAAWNTRKPIEQIVERLEFQAEESRDYWSNFDDEYAFGAMNAYTNAIEIVKEELDAK